MRVFLLLAVLLSPTLSQATSITILGGTDLITSGINEVSFSAIDSSGNIYQASTYTVGFGPPFGLPGETITYVAPLANYGALSINGQTISPGGPNNPNGDVYYILSIGGSVQLPSFLTPGPLTVTGTFNMSGTIGSCNLNGCTT